MKQIFEWFAANAVWIWPTLVGALLFILARCAKYIQKYAWLFQLAVTVIEKIYAAAKEKEKNATNADDKEVAAIEVASLCDVKSAFTAGKIELSPANIAIAEEMIQDVSAMIKEKKNPNRDKSFFGFLKVLAAIVIPGIRVENVIKPKEDKTDE